MIDWQDIETALKDGTELDLWSALTDSRFPGVKWCESHNAWMSVHSGDLLSADRLKFTHWRLAPDRPVVE